MNFVIFSFVRGLHTCLSCTRTSLRAPEWRVRSRALERSSIIVCLVVGHLVRVLFRFAKHQVITLSVQVWTCVFDAPVSCVELFEWKGAQHVFMGLADGRVAVRAAHDLRPLYSLSHADSLVPSDPSSVLRSYFLLPACTMTDINPSSGDPRIPRRTPGVETDMPDGYTGFEQETVV